MSSAICLVGASIEVSWHGTMAVSLPQTDVSVGLEGKGQTYISQAYPSQKAIAEIIGHTAGIQLPASDAGSQVLLRVGLTSSGRR